MSDLAPFVAAVLRDRTVDELMEENAQLKSTVDALMRIEITGRKGTPVYAEGQFNHGHYGPNIDAWIPNLEHKRDCPFVDLGGLEIRVGGLVRYSLAEDCDRPRIHIGTVGDGRGGEGKELAITFADLMLEAVIHGIRDLNDTWRRRIDAIWDVSASVALRRLNRLPNREECAVRIESIQLSVETYTTLIDLVPMSQEQKLERQERLARHAFPEAVWKDMRRLAPATVLDDFRWYLDTEILLARLGIEVENDEYNLVIEPVVNFFASGATRPSSDLALALIDQERLNHKEHRPMALADFVLQLQVLTERLRGEIPQR